MKAILIIILGVAAGWFVLTHYIKKPEGLKPILPEVFFEPPEDSQSIVVDFGSCPAGKGESKGEFGSVNIEVWSENVNVCHFDYMYAGQKWVKCLVPKTIGSLKFKKTFDRINFADISSYCSVD